MAVHGHDDADELPATVETRKCSPTRVAMCGVGFVFGLRNRETRCKCVGESDRLVGQILVHQARPPALERGLLPGKPDAAAPGRLFAATQPTSDHDDRSPDGRRFGGDLQRREIRLWIDPEEHQICRGPIGIEHPLSRTNIGRVLGTIEFDVRNTDVCRGQYPPAPQIDGCPGIAIADIGPAGVIGRRFQTERIILTLDDEADGSSRRKNEYGEGESDWATKSEFGIRRDVRTPLALS